MQGEENGHNHHTFEHLSHGCSSLAFLLGPGVATFENDGKYGTSFE
jgi:hypothetical protein